MTELSSELKNVKVMSTTYRLLFHFLLILNVINGNNEVITLQKQNHVKCITEDIRLPIYISPPIADTKHNSSLLVNGTWTDDDWSEEDASNFNRQGFIADKRWEDFETLYTKYQRFIEQSSVSVSIYTPASIQIFMYHNESAEYVKIDQNNSQKWIHLNIFLENGNVLVFENNQNIRTYENFAPNRIVIKTRTKTFWKKHKDQFKWANTITQEKLTTLTVPPNPDKKCLMFYVSVCQGCTLDIVSATEEQIPPVINSNDELTTIDSSWQLRLFNVQPEKEYTFSFVRGRGDDSIFGKWAVDVRWCPDMVNDKVIYEVDLPKTDQQSRTCHLLEDQAIEVNGENLGDSKQSETFQCKPGTLGKKCDIICQDYLGSGGKYCEEHRVCENSECKCTWGVYGKSCEIGCSSGHWGLSCEKSCDTTCKECNNVTGECFEDGILKVFIVPEKLPYLILIAIAGGLLLSVGLIVLRKHVFKHSNHKKSVIDEGKLIYGTPM